MPLHTPTIARRFIPALVLTLAARGLAGQPPRPRRLPRQRRLQPLLPRRLPRQHRLQPPGRRG